MQRDEPPGLRLLARTWKHTGKGGEGCTSTREGGEGWTSSCEQQKDHCLPCSLSAVSVVVQLSLSLTRALTHSFMHSTLTRCLQRPGPGEPAARPGGEANGQELEVGDRLGWAEPVQACCRRCPCCCRRSWCCCSCRCCCCPSCCCCRRCRRRSCCSLAHRHVCPVPVASLQCRFRGVSKKKGKWEAKVMVNRRWAYRELFDRCVSVCAGGGTLTVGALVCAGGGTLTVGALVGALGGWEAAQGPLGGCRGPLWGPFWAAGASAGGRRAAPMPRAAPALGPTSDANACPPPRPFFAPSAQRGGGGACV